MTLHSRSVDLSEKGESMIRGMRLTAAIFILFALQSCEADREGSSQRIDVGNSTIVNGSSTPFADGVDQAIVNVTLRNAAGAAIAGQVVEFRVQGSNAKVDQPGRTDATGVASARLASTQAGSTTLLVVVNPGPGEVVLNQSFQVDFLTAPDASLSTVVLGRSTAPANDETTVSVQATLRDGSGNPLSGHTVRFDVDDPNATIVQPTTTTDAAGLVTGSVRSSTVGALRVLSSVNPLKRPMLLHGQPSVTFVADPLSVDDGELVYGESGLAAPRLRSFANGGSTWSSESNLVTVSTTIRNVVDRFSPVSRHERIAAVLSENASAARLSLMRQNGDGWVESFQQNDYPFAHVDKRGFDLCFEASSGDALLVWTDGTARLKYRHKSGATWSEATALPINDGSGPNPDPTTGVPLWVEMVARPGSNEVALAYVDDNDDLVTVIWNGALWETGSVTVHTQTATTNAVTGVPHNRGFDLAYESSTKGLVCAWGDASFATGFRWARRDPATQLWTSAASVTLQNGVAEHVDLAADPSSDRIALACFDLGGTERLGLAMWTGAAWTHAVEIDSQIRDVNHTARSDWPGEVAWVGSTGVAVCVYPDNTPARLDWCRYTVSGGWSAQTPVSWSGKSFTESAVLRSFASANKVMAIVGDSFGKLYAASYDGTSWTQLNSAAPLESSLSTLAGRAFDYSVKER